ncbi:hypothetical protein KDX27_22640 [Burkholderia cenocepacia]|uniref:hypothetical protein n=1 Tax=Burkholderia cenocepacia TaxID=95486 RepID=UPI001B94641E|nr:hypothetical protein [Burkholderia cenocepacia]MBR8027806.1 hypothetical protein [Burkholderia cenocepacia]MBR8170536.1 hypothetical protein [Burkholderia cenocepacia]
MVTTHFGNGFAPSVNEFKVIDDFGTLWTLVPDADYFGDFDDKPARAAMAFQRSGEVH